MGRLLNFLFGPQQEPLPPIEDGRVQAVINLLNSHKATINTRLPVHRRMWESWSQELAKAIVEAIGESLVNLRKGAYEHPDLRVEFQARIIELADEFDARDHEESDDHKGTELQDECMELRQLARSLAAKMKQA